MLVDSQTALGDGQGCHHRVNTRRQSTAAASTDRARCLRSSSALCVALVPLARSSLRRGLMGGGDLLRRKHTTALSLLGSLD